MLSLDSKITLSDKRIWDWYNSWGGEVYISFSGGKDSTVLRHLVKKQFPDVPAVFCDTGLEYPEVRSFAMANADEVIKPKLTFKQVIEKYGYPFPTKEQALYIRNIRHTKSEKLRQYRLNGDPKSGRFGISARWKILIDAPFECSEKCCDVMKKKPFADYEKRTGRHPILGTMACESSLRRQKYLQHGCNSFFAKRPQSTPLGFWTEQDVLEYIARYNLEYASVYGKVVHDGEKYLCTGVNRTGCMFCLFGVYLESEPNRFQKMAITHPKQYEYCMEKLGIRQVLEYVGVPHEPPMLLFDPDKVVENDLRRIEDARNRQNARLR